MHPVLAVAPDVLQCRDPATGEQLGQVPVMEVDDVAAIVARARTAQAGWSRSSPSRRRALFRSLLQTIVAGQDEICRLAMHDTGKTMLDAALGEVLPVCEALRRSIASRPQNLPRPRDVVAVIAVADDDCPFATFMSAVMQGLFAGNAVVVKVCEHSSWSSTSYTALVRDILREHGLDPDLVQIVTGYEEAARALASSTRAEVSSLRRSSDALVVLDDADLEQVVSAARLCTRMGAERAYVHHSIHDRFVALAARKIRSLRQGPPLEQPVDCGATISSERLERIAALVDEALAQGARAVVGGKVRTDLPGHYFEPTLLADIHPDMRIAHEVVGGPVALVVPFFDDEHAVRLANDGATNRRCSVFSRDRRRARRLAGRIPASASMVHAGLLAPLPYDLVESATRLLYGRGLRCRARAALDVGRRALELVR